MKLSFGTVLRDKFLQKAIRKLRIYISEFKSCFEELEIQPDNCESILISLSCDINKERVFSNSDNVFQIMLPISDIPEDLRNNPKELFLYVADKIIAGISRCPYLSSDNLHIIKNLFNKWKAEVLDKLS